MIYWKIFILQLDDVWLYLTLDSYVDILCILLNITNSFDDLLLEIVHPLLLKHLSLFKIPHFSH